MPYARTLLEVAIAQALFLGGFLLAPINLVDVMGPVPTGMIVSALALGAAQLVYNRHRKRLVDHAFGRKLHVLRTAAE